MFLRAVFLISSGLFTSCVPIFPPSPAELFTAPLVINGTPVDDAILDTGGGYELILRESYGLPVTGSLDVLAFAGVATVEVTGGFDYEVAGVTERAESALLSGDVCDCNGVGFHFLRRTGRVLALDYTTMQADLTRVLPLDGTVLAFAEPPSVLANFDTAFIEVTISSGSSTKNVLALLDTGTNSSVLRRNVLPDGSFLTPNHTEIIISEPSLGSVAVTARLFETVGLPDLILGTDVMQAWSSRWFFYFAPRGGLVVTYPNPRTVASVSGRNSPND